MDSGLRTCAGTPECRGSAADLVKGYEVDVISILGWKGVLLREVGAVGCQAPEIRATPPRWKL